MPDNLKTRFDRLQYEMKADDVVTEEVGKKDETRGWLDDEYQTAGITDPKVLLTTCRDPTNKLLRFVKEMKLCLPHSIRLNRGNVDVSELVNVARAAGLFVCLFFCANSQSFFFFFFCVCSQQI